MGGPFDRSGKWLSAAIGVVLMALGGCESDGDSPSNARSLLPHVQTGFIQREATLPDGSKRKYSVYIPRGYDPAKRWPAVMFLQGIGEGGTDGKQQTTVGLGPAIRKQEKTFELIAIFPQSGGLWSSEDADRIAMAALDDVQTGYNVDLRRIYLTGLSTGGWGTWAIGARHADRFAALAPMCGRSGEAFADKLTRMPIWAFANSLDPFVWSVATHDTVEAINKKGGHAKATIYTAIGHDCWSRTYADRKFWAWLLAQKKD